MLLLQFVCAIVYMLFILLTVIVALFINKLLKGIFILQWIASAVILVALVYSVVMLAVFAIPVSYGSVSVLYYRHKAEIGEAVIHCKAPEHKVSKHGTRLIRWCSSLFMGLIAAGSLTLGFMFFSGRWDWGTAYTGTVEITAHRGASRFYPENTMAAFEGAKQLGAEWIELDVQQSKDGQIIVIHDTNFRRTTSVAANTWELNYDEIVELDAGSFFDIAYAGEKIPLLSEVVLFALENDMKLNIELKPTGHEKDFVKCVIDIIKQEGFENFCVITSQVYEVLEQVKAYDNSISTVYVMSLAYGDINQLAAADHFSVEATSATPGLISRVHQAGKQIYVWTVNTKENIDKMIGLGVDNIITDDIRLAKQCVYESRYSNWLTEYLKLFQ